MKHDTLPYSHPVSVATLHGQTFLKLAPNESERAAIARELGLDELSALRLDLSVTHAQSGMVSVSGTLHAALKPVCVVSLEPFAQVLDVPLELRFAPQPMVERLIKRAEEEENEDFEPPDVIEDGSIDFGQMACEFLALALDPYPKKPGAEFNAAGDAPEVPVSPFAALAELKGKV